MQKRAELFQLESWYFHSSKSLISCCSASPRRVYSVITRLSIWAQDLYPNANAMIDFFPWIKQVKEQKIPFNVPVTQTYHFKAIYNRTFTNLDRERRTYHVSKKLKQEKNAKKKRISCCDKTLLLNVIRRKKQTRKKELFRRKRNTYQSY